MHCCRRDPTKHIPVVAFITFEQEEGRLRALDLYPESTPLWCCQSKRKRLDGRYRVWVEEAPEPTDIEWKNQDVTPREKCCKKSIAITIAVILILISFGVILGVKTAQTTVSRLFPDVNCAKFGNVTKTQAIIDKVRSE